MDKMPQFVFTQITPTLICFEFILLVEVPVVKVPNLTSWLCKERALFLILFNIMVKE